MVIIFLLGASASYGQISPGDLSSAHANLEGMSNCTQCHDLGKKVSNIKCLECHKEIQSLISQDRGYHANAEVTGKDCFDCHSEHHGRKFEMIRFDEKEFNHQLTNYNLEGQHTVVDCRECHKPDYIADIEIRKREKTFLGLDQKCLTCHDDYHQNTLSNDCVACHDMKAFRPASKFDHNDADFRLRGAHIEVDCKECHEINTRNGMEFQVFTDIPHTDCRSCHEDPHNAHLPGSCTQCHTEKSFTTFVGKNNFDHGTTNFDLRGKHQSVDCFSCHQNTKASFTIFQDLSGVPENNCVKCHEDVHEGKFGNDCAKCHTETGFLALKSMNSFDHNVTDFPLVGNHIGVDCKLCHTGKYTEAIDFSACKNCHEDYHNGEFVENGLSPDCVECHSLEQGFGETLYTLEQHQTTKFPLEGAHMATACNQCHVSEDQWSFKNMGSSCIECHDNVHEDRFAVDGITDCERCHDSDSWFPSKFDHNITAFPLEGRHAEIECRLCHLTYVEDGKTLVQYKIEKFECIDCHQ